MAMPAYVGAWEYRNSAGTPVDLTGKDIDITITFTNLNGAGTIGVSVYMEDSLGASHETDQTWPVASFPSAIVFAITDYTPHVDVSDIVFMRVGFGVDGGYYETIYFHIGDAGGGGE